MRYILRTAGRMAKKFYKWANENGHECVSFADMNHSLWGDFIEGIPVESLMKAVGRYKSQADVKMVIAVDAPVKTIRDMCRECVGMGFEASDLLIVTLDFIRGNADSPTLLPYPNYNALEYLEFHVTHRCNLNCAGCSHFVPIIPGDVEVDFGELKKDLAKLKKIVSHIGNIRIMGGEPLLSAHLAECCNYVRKLFPFSNIRVVSNGALVMSMDPNLVETMRRCHISFDITCYPPLYDRYEEIADFLDKNGIEGFMDIRWGMCPVLHQDNSHQFKHDDTSLACECHNLYNGHLFPCPLTAYIDFFNMRFHQNFPSDEGVDIYGVKSFRDLWDRLTEEKRMCDFCDHYGMTKNNRRRPFRLAGQNPSMEDWIRDYGNEG